MCRWFMDRFGGGGRSTPAPVIMGGPGSGLDPTMSKVFFFSVLALHVLMIFLIVERYGLEKMRAEVEGLQREVEG